METHGQHNQNRFTTTCNRLLILHMSTTPLMLPPRVGAIPWEHTSLSLSATLQHTYTSTRQCLPSSWFIESTSSQIPSLTQRNSVCLQVCLSASMSLCLCVYVCLSVSAPMLLSCAVHCLLSTKNAVSTQCAARLHSARRLWCCTASCFQPMWHSQCHCMLPLSCCIIPCAKQGKHGKGAGACPQSPQCR